MLRLVVAALFGAGLSLVTQAATAVTFSEATFGDFSGHWRHSTVVSDPNVDRIEGTWSGYNDYDLLLLEGLEPGEQTLTLSFYALGKDAKFYHYSAGGALLFKTSPYLYSAWEGVTLGKVQLDWANSDPVDFTLKTTEEFSGTLFLGLYGTHGSLGYSLTGMQWASVGAGDPIAVNAAIPIPATVTFSAAALAMLAWAARRRNA